MRQAEIIVIGEAFVDFLPKGTGPLSHIDGFEMHCGGAPCNVARGIARLGVGSRFVSVIGADEFSDFVLEQLRLAGVHTDAVRRLSEGRMQLCFVTLDDRGDRQFTGRGPDASLSLGVQDIRPEHFAHSEALVLTCGSLRTRQGVFAVDRALQYARGLICCDPGTCPPEWCEPRLMNRRLWSVFTRCDVVKCADHETYWLTEEDDPLRAAQRLVQEGVKLAVVTCGARGAVWARAGGASGSVPAPHVSVVDTTGAGDAFMSALTAWLVRAPAPLPQLTDAQVEEAIRFAAFVGARSVMVKGAVHGIPLMEAPRLPEPEGERVYDDR